MESLDNFKKTQRRGIKSFSTDQKNWNFFFAGQYTQQHFWKKKNEEEENITVSSKNILSPGYFSFSIVWVFQVKPAEIESP